MPADVTLFDYYVIEVINRGLLVLLLTAMFVIGRYVIITFRNYGFKRYRLNAAISLLIIWFGEIVKTGAIVWVRVREDNDMVADWVVRHQAAFYILGAAILSVGFACFIRIWSPQEWGHRPWMIAGTAALIAALVPVSWMVATYTTLGSWLAIALQYAR